MASPFSDQIESKPNDPVHQRVLAQFQGDWVEHLNVEQMFILIDGALPFEACLYYQVLPLFLDGSHLNLGMVSSDDAAASDYVRRMISYLNYSLVPREISSEALQTALSAYLHHTGKQSIALPKSPATQNNHYTRPPARSRTNQQIDHNLQPTFIVDSPDDLNLIEVVRASQPLSAPPNIPFEPPPPAIEVKELKQPEPKQPEPKQPLDPSPSASSDPSALSAVEEENSPPQVPPALYGEVPTLDIQAQHLTSALEVLATFPPKQLLQELLGRVLLGGIGRLYFERQPQHGRILWSQNGVLQSVVDKLELDVFQGLINELKRMTQLPMLPVEKPRQIEIERVYQQTRLLLRFRFMPVANGEEATVQVLRGAALKFYQQQQLTNLGRDALGIARQLQQKVSEIRRRSHSDPSLSSSPIDSLLDLNQLLHSIEEQLDDLKAYPDSEDFDA